MREFIEVEIDSSTTGTGVKNVALTATTNSNWIDTKRATQVVLEFDVVNGGGAAIPVVFYIDSQKDTDVSTISRQEMVGVDGAAAGGEVVTALNRRKYSRTTEAAATTQSFTIPLAALYNRIRVVGLTAAGAGATDLVTLCARVRF